MYVWELPATNWEGIGVWSMEGTVFFRTPLQSPSKMGAKEPQEFSFCYLPPVNFSFKTSWNCRKYSEWPFWNTSPHFKYLHPSSILLYLICLIHVSFGATRWSGEVGCCWTAPSQWWTAFSRGCCFQRSNARWISPRLASPWSTTWWDCCPLVWPFTLKDHARQIPQWPVKFEIMKLVTTSWKFASGFKQYAFG